MKTVPILLGFQYNSERTPCGFRWTGIFRFNHFEGTGKDGAWGERQHDVVNAIMRREIPKQSPGCLREETTITFFPDNECVVIVRDEQVFKEPTR